VFIYEWMLICLLYSTLWERYVEVADIARDSTSILLKFLIEFMYQSPYTHYTNTKIWKKNKEIPIMLLYCFQTKKLFF